MSWSPALVWGPFFPLLLVASALNSQCAQVGGWSLRGMRAEPSFHGCIICGQREAGVLQTGGPIPRPPEL